MWSKIRFVGMVSEQVIIRRRNMASVALEITSILLVHYYMVDLTNLQFALKKVAFQNDSVVEIEAVRIVFRVFGQRSFWSGG